MAAAGADRRFIRQTPAAGQGRRLPGSREGAGRAGPALIGATGGESHRDRSGPWRGEGGRGSPCEEILAPGILPKQPDLGSGT